VPRRILLLVGLVLVLLALAAAWRWTPLGDWLEIENLAAAAQRLAAMPAAPLAVVGAFIVAGFLVIPLTVLAIATVLVFGPVTGFAYTLAGASLSAAASYAVGRALGHDAVKRLAGARLNRLSRKLARRGVLAVVAVRLVPVAPFTIVNLVAGASHIRLRDFLIGTVIGLAPGLIAISFFTDGIAATIADPSPRTLAIFAAIVVVIAAGALVLRRRLRED
jgi:phospholipase D1/2